MDCDGVGVDGAFGLAVKFLFGASVKVPCATCWRKEFD